MRNRVADYKYIYDPNHEKKPAGSWNRTNSGWSSNVNDNTGYKVSPIDR